MVGDVEARRDAPLQLLEGESLLHELSRFGCRDLAKGAHGLVATRRVTQQAREGRGGPGSTGSSQGQREARPSLMRPRGSAGSAK